MCSALETSSSFVSCGLYFGIKPFFIEELKNPTFVLRRGIGRISQLWKGPFGEQLNPGGCYRNRGFAIQSVKMFLTLTDEILHFCVLIISEHQCEQRYRWFEDD